MLTPEQAKELAWDKQFIDVVVEGYRFRWQRSSRTMQVWKARASVSTKPLETIPIPDWLNNYSMDEEAVRAAGRAWLANRPAGS